MLDFFELPVGVEPLWFLRRVIAASQSLGRRSVILGQIGEGGKAQSHMIVFL